jgi:hypothetical protein
MLEPLEASALYEALRSKAEVNYSYSNISYDNAIALSVGLQLNEPNPSKSHPRLEQNWRFWSSCRCGSTQGQLSTSTSHSLSQRNWRIWCDGYCESTPVQLESSGT